MATVQLSSAPDPVVAVPSSGVTYEVDGQVLERASFTPFVVYRVALGGYLLWYAYGSGI